MATMPLRRATYLAPRIPIEILKKTGNGIPCFCEGFPIKLEKKYTSSEPTIHPDKTQKNSIYKLNTKMQLMKNQLYFVYWTPRNKKDLSSSKFYYWD